jgi:CcmD family protein
MDTRNFTYMFYGFLAAWLILCAYVVALVARERKLKREVERLRLLVEEKEHTG